MYFLYCLFDDFRWWLRDTRRFRLCSFRLNSTYWNDANILTRVEFRKWGYWSFSTSTVTYYRPQSNWTQVCLAATRGDTDSEMMRLCVAALREYRTTETEQQIYEQFCGYTLDEIREAFDGQNGETENR